MSWSLNCKGRCGNAFHAYLNLSEKPQAMDKTQAIWIKDPLAILADGAARGIVVRDGRIVELVPKGGQPTTTARFFEAGDHAGLPGLIYIHHHFYQTPTRAPPAVPDPAIFSWPPARHS